MPIRINELGTRLSDMGDLEKAKAYLKLYQAKEYCEYNETIPEDLLSELKKDFADSPDILISIDHIQQHQDPGSCLAEILNGKNSNAFHPNDHENLTTKDVAYIPIEDSHNYSVLLRAILKKMKQNGFDMTGFSTINYAGLHNSRLTDFVASVSHRGKVRIGDLTGYDAKNQELFLIHEYRHLEQNQKEWVKICIKHGLDPYQYSYQKLTTDDFAIPHDYKIAIHEFKEWFDDPEAVLYCELDADIFSTDYFYHFMEKDFPISEKILSSLSNMSRIQMRQDDINAYYTNQNKPLPKDLKKLMNKARSLEKNLSQDISFNLSTPNRKKEFIEHLNKKMTYWQKAQLRTLAYSDGQKLNAQEKLVILRGARMQLRIDKGYCEMLKSYYPSLSSDLNELIKKAELAIKNIDANLEKMTIGFALGTHGTDPLYKLFLSKDLSLPEIGHGSWQADLELRVIEKDIELSLGVKRNYYYLFDPSKSVKLGLQAYTGVYQKDQKAAAQVHLGAELSFQASWAIYLKQDLSLEPFIQFNQGGALDNTLSLNNRTELVLGTQFSF